MSIANAGAGTITPNPVSTVDGENAPALRISAELHRFDYYLSNCADENLRVGKRLDPYWGDLWSIGAKASWVDLKAARAQFNAGVSRIPRYLSCTDETAEKAISDLAKLPEHLDIISVLDTWRAATSQQLAVLTGHSHLATGRARTMTNMFTAELVDVGVFTNALYSSRGIDGGTIYRSNTGDAFEKKIAPALTYAEWLSTTGATKNPVGGGGHDRHNIITTELAIRIAELCLVGNVVGEKFSLLDTLAYTGLGRPSRGENYNRAADMTVIREDGARIAIEVTATVGKSFELKVAHWAELIASRPMDTSGLAVMFVIIDRQDGKIGRRVRNQVHKIVREAVRNFPGTSGDRVASRIGVADWREWFPADGIMSPAFETLECNRPTGPADDLWERASFLDPADVPFAPASDWPLTALNNMALLRSVPHWLRDGRTPPDLFSVQLAAAGYDSVPVPELSRPELTPGTREFGKAHGFVAATKPPKRMREKLPAAAAKSETRRKVS